MHTPPPNPALQLLLSGEELNVILTALAERPYREVHELIANLRAQTERQLLAPGTSRATT